jgi:hypothetical protein
MLKTMKRNFKLFSLLALLFITALGTAMWATYTFSRPFEPFMPVLPPPRGYPGDLEIFYTAQTIVSSLNVVLLVYIFANNVDIFRKTKSKFTFGLLIFSGAFLVKDLTSNPIIIWLFGYHPQGLGPFALLPNVFEFLVLCTLLYLSNE